MTSRWIDLSAEEEAAPLIKQLYSPESVAGSSAEMRSVPLDVATLYFSVSLIICWAKRVRSRQIFVPNVAGR